MISVKTTRYQCRGCDHLCALLTDGVVVPEDIISCKKSPYSSWQIIPKSTQQGGDKQ